MASTATFAATGSSTGSPRRGGGRFVTTNQKNFRDIKTERVVARKLDLQTGSSIFPEGKFEAHSATSDDFKQWEYARREPAKPLPAQLALVDRTAKFDGSSESQSSFINMGVARRKPIRPVHSAMDHTGPFQGNSTTRDDFASFPGALPAESAKPKLTERDDAQDTRDFQTEGRAGFSPKSYAKRPLIRPPPATIHDKGAFQGMSSTRSDFQDFGHQAPPKSYKPVLQAQMTADSRDFKTDYGTSFQPSGQTHYFRAKAPTTTVPHQLDGAGQRFDGLSTTRADFHAYPGAKPSASVKPTQSALDSGPDDRAFDTETRAHFVKKASERPDSFKPRHRSLDYEPETRDFKSEYGQNHINQPYARRQPFGPVPSQVIDKKPFEGASVSAEDYKRYHGATPSKSAKPGLSTTSLTAGAHDDRSFTTDYGEQFTGKRADRVMAAEVRAKLKAMSPGNPLGIDDDDNTIYDD